MKHVLSLMLVLCLPSCAASSPSNQLVGEWHFADIRNATFPPDAMTPPFFDVIEFKANGTVRLERKLSRLVFDGHYAVTDGIITWTFQPSDAPRPVEHGVYYSWLADGELALRGANAQDSSEATVQWVFLRPDKFLPLEDVAGEWHTLSDSGEIEATRSLLPDGQLGGGDEESFWGHFRLWQSESGLMLTTLMWVQGSGAYAVFEKTEIHKDRMILTPRTAPGFTEQPARVWYRSQDELAPDEPSEMVNSD